MKLQKLSDYIDGVQNEPQHYDSADEHYKVVCNKLTRIYTYSEFLQTHLNIGMFVPAIEVDGKLVVLEPLMDFDYQPIGHDLGTGKYPQECYETDLEQYQQAKDRVFFSGNWEFFIDKIYDFKTYVNLGNFKIHPCSGEIIEDLIYYNLELTEYGQSKLK